MDQALIIAPNLIPEEYQQIFPETTLQELTCEDPVFSFLLQGELCLLGGFWDRGLEFFEKAVGVFSQGRGATEVEAFALWYRQGLALVEYGFAYREEKAFTLACKKFKQAALFSSYKEGSKEADRGELWSAWAEAVLLLGKYTGQARYFLAAKEKYEKVLAFYPEETLMVSMPLNKVFEENYNVDDSPEEKARHSTLRHIWRRYAMTYSQLAKTSGEAYDWQMAVDAFDKASFYTDVPEVEELDYTFWEEYGLACLELAKMIKDFRQYLKATCYLNKAFELQPLYRLALSLAQAHHAYYNYCQAESIFFEAHEAYLKAATLQRGDELWTSWGRLLCDAARYYEETRELKTFITHCQNEAACSEKSPFLLATWAEALALEGQATDRGELIEEGYQKALRTLEIRLHPDLYYACGFCLYTMGHYFKDTDYFYQAIEYFQGGLSLDRTIDRLWHAIALCYTAIGVKEEEEKLIEKALYFYKKALKLSPCYHYIFDYGSTLLQLGELTHQRKWIEESLVQFDRMLQDTVNTVLLHSGWFFQRACALDALGDFSENPSYYTEAVELFTRVLNEEKDFPQASYRLALALSHLGDLLGESSTLQKAHEHFAKADMLDKENDEILLDWGVNLLNTAYYSENTKEAPSFYREAEEKLFQAAKLGNLQAYYHLSCLYALLEQYDKAMFFMEKAAEQEALPSVEEILSDEWLDGLRDRPDFQNLLLEIENYPKER